ncbi:FAD-dependent oxidoreductase [Rhizocola hellebori]|uniref:FAD-dependent oxidoreductase n=1 Tax=Rhizocola hellebori TaxID=1392758 RepID=A0A8J3VEJ3_9ACTN|nr:FAD-dependent oxidoreductase [Rhizocola hellebori]
MVVGGGIGGLAAAVALRRAGWTVTVLERAPQFGEVGAGLTLMSNALRGLEALGLGEAVRAAGVVDAPGGTRSVDGKWISRVDSTQMTRMLGIAALGIHRATLHRILAAALPPESLVTDALVTEVEPGPARVHYLRRGDRVTAQADLVVGADGINSGVRAQWWPQAPAPVYQGSTAWRAVTRARWEGDLAMSISWGPGAEFGMVPLGDGRVYWYGAVNSPPGQRNADEMAAVRRRFGSWHEPIPALMAATDPDALLRNDIYYLGTELATYVKANVALLGDAAHAMTPNLGQGAGQAIEDAVVLGVACAGAKDVESALAWYDSQRRPRSQSVARAAKMVGRIGQQLHNPVAVALRDTLMRLTPPRAALRSMARYADWTPPTWPG